MNSERPSERKAWPARRTILRRLTALGAVGALAGCTTNGSTPSTPSPGGSSGLTSTPAPTTPTPTEAAAGGGSASFDCGTIPTSLTAFEPTEVEFSFACDAPPQPEYGMDVGEDAVERVASFYFARDGAPSMNNWDFHVDLSESVDTYGDVSGVAPNATEAFGLDYGGTTVPVRHQAITDDHDIWVVGLPEDGAFRLVRLSAAVMPDQFGCHDTVRAIGRDVVESIHQR